MKMTWKDFEAHLKNIEAATPVDYSEDIGVKSARIKTALSDYGFFCQHYFPHYCKAPNAKFHNDFANNILANHLFKGIFEGFRGTAKSTHAGLFIPIWLMFKSEMKNMVYVGETHDKAKRLIGSIQAELMKNQRIINDFGEQYQHGDWSDGSFVTRKGVAFMALGLGQSPRGIREGANRPDYILCDDCDTKERSKNPRRVREAVEWIEDDLMGCFDIGNERFVFVNSRISKNSILANLHETYVLHKPKTERWYYLLVNAIDAKGNSTWKEKYTNEYWEAKRQSKTLRAWLKEYMNNPIEEGTIFKYDWVQWKKALPYKDYEYLIAYCDPSFKNTPGSDYKAIKMWGKRGKELHKLKAFVRQCSISTMVQFFYDLHENLPEGVICDYYMEANFLQDMILDEFTVEGEKRGYQLPIRPDKRAKPDKFSRIEATSPLYERGFIFYNEAEKSNPDMQRAIEHLLAFEQGAKTPDDSPDADEGAIYILQKRGRSQQFQPVVGSRTHKNSY
jgi:hypothetical protein